MTINHRETVAIRKINHPANFVWYAWECLDGEDGPVMLTGCVSSGLITKGKRKGLSKYDGDPVRVVVTDPEMLAERRRYESETGNCAECGGDGQAFKGWDHIKGTEWRVCPKCDGSGKPRATNAVDPVGRSDHELTPRV